MIGLLTGLAAAFVAGFAAGLTGATTFLAAGLTAGFAIVLPTALPLVLVFLTTTFLGAGFLAAAFFTALTAGLAAGFLAGLGFFGCALAAAFLTAGLATAFLALPAGLATGRTAFAGFLLVLFTTDPFAAAAFDLPALAACALAGAFLCAIAAVELRVVFAISLHHFWPWRPGVIAQVFYTSKPASGILVPLHAASRSGNVTVLTRLILWLLHLYKRWLSPLLGQRCRFHPSCSDYARIAVTRFGPWRGSLLATWRLLRCQPLCAGGEDPVPERFHLPRCRCQGDAPDVH